MRKPDDDDDGLVSYPAIFLYVLVMLYRMSQIWGNNNGRSIRPPTTGGDA